MDPQQPPAWASYITVAQRHLDEFAPVVAALAGRS